MIKPLNNFRNLGINSSLDQETVQRIRIANSMSIFGISTAFIVLFYSSFMNWPRYSILLLIFAVIATFIPPWLNFLNRTVASRISFLLIANVLTVIFSIVFDPSLHFHYFLLSLIGLPFIFFENEIGRSKVFFAALGILLFIFLECSFYFFEPLSPVNFAYSNVIRFINDVLVGMFIFAQFYFFVSENDRYIEEIKTQSNELNDKNTQLEHFAYIASHDLKEPIRTVNSFVDIIKEEYGTRMDENLSTYFAFIDESIIRMQKMNDGLLAYSKIGRSPNFQRVDLNHLIAEVTLDLGKLIDEKKALIHCSSDLPMIYAIRSEIKQLFQSLISNAIKFQSADNPPLIRLSWREEPDFWEFCVADNGIGITGKKQTEIFQMFTKLHLPSKYEGHGIGLAFCKKIVELHHGKIWVASSPEQGSQFYFTIKKQTPY